MYVEQSSCSPTDANVVSFATDAMKRFRQLVLILWEYVTSFTATLSARYDDFVTAFSYSGCH